MAGEDDSLLDVFVTIGERGLKETETEIDAFIARTKKKFGESKSLEMGAGVAASLKKNLRDAQAAVKESAEKIKNELRQSLLKFGQEKDLLSIQVRLLGDDDINRRLQDIQSRVSAATKTFNLAEPGEAGDPQRQSSIAQINALREQELAILREITNEQIKQRGLESVYENQADAFLKATQNSQSFNQQLRELNRLVSSTKDTPLISEFSKLKTEIERAQLALRQGLASGNLVDIDDATAQLNTLRLQFDRFRDDAEKAIVIRTNAEEISANFTEMLARLQRNDARDASLTRGSALSGDQRIALAELKREVSEITFEFRKLSSQTDLTAKDIQDLAVLFDRLKTASTNIGDIRQEVIATGPQLNTLSNNAYQLGQAFEDAAIGFQLNGLSGAFRGASNNISFLIQNLAQSGALTSSLGEKAAKLIPLYAGIGAALGFTVLPPLLDWLSTLNDIEVKTRDIDKLIEDAFSDARFQVSIELDAQSALKAIQDSKDAEDAIAEVIKQAEEAEKLKFKINAELGFVNERDVFSGIEDFLDEIRQLSAKRIAQVSAPLIDAGNPAIGDVPIVIPPNQDDIDKAIKFNEALDLVRNSYALAQEQAAKGIVPTTELENARNGVRRLRDGFDELVQLGSISEANAAELKKGLDALQGPLSDATEEAKRFEAAQAAILEDGLKALGLFKGISDEYKFLDAVNDGRLRKEDKILFDMQQQNIALEEQAAKARELFGRNPQVEAAIENREDVLREEQRIDLAGEVLSIEEQIAEKRKDADKDSERASKRRADLEERIADERIRSEKRVADAQKALNDELDAQQLSATEDRIQKRIEALQKAETQSRNFQLGDVGTIAFGPDTKSEVERLQQQLKDLRESAGKAADEERIRELNERILSERQESQNRIQDLRDDLAEARQEEIDALNDNAEEINKLIEQLKLLEGALQQIQNGGPLGIPELGPGGERNGPMFLPEGDIEAIGNAQANANAAAMRNVDFKSSSIETLIGQSNRLLSSMNATLQNQDLQPRLV